MRAEALPLPVLDCACASLRRAARAVTQAYDAALQGTGLRATQFTLLQALERTGTTPQMALGELLALDPTTLSRTLRPSPAWQRAQARLRARLRPAHWKLLVEDLAAVAAAARRA